MAQRTRFDRVAAALAACALVAAFCSLADAKHRSAPHVVLLVLDDTGWNHVPWHSGDAKDQSACYNDEKGPSTCTKKGQDESSKKTQTR